MHGPLWRAGAEARPYPDHGNRSKPVKRGTRLLAGLLAALLAALVLLAWQWPTVEQTLLDVTTFRPPEPPPPVWPQLPVRLVKLADDFTQITDLQPLPPPFAGDLWVVLQKPGDAFVFNPATGARKLLLHKDVATSSEEGLLGLAFDPKFSENRQFYTNSVVTERDQDKTSIDLWQLPADPFAGNQAIWIRRILQFDQPYANHNAGQLTFGPDGLLYIGTGDGGSGGDPHGNGQNRKTWLGKMLRIDVSHSSATSPYSVPADNPFVTDSTTLPEIWALGLRNPWRYSFDSEGRLWVTDVGQNRYDEIDIVRKGDNLGWNVREARHCFEPAQGCASQGFADPYWQGSHPPHIAAIGGYVYEGHAIAALRGKFVFGDFGVGRLFAIDGSAPAGKQPQMYWLCAHRLAVTTFGRGRDGELLVGDLNGTIWRVAADL